MGKRELGKKGEKLALDLLRHRGYRILGTNVRTPIGEIDIIGEEGNELVLIEVRTRASQSFGTPEESLTRDKKERLTALADYYLQLHPHYPSWRIDLVALELSPEGKLSRAEVLKNAIEDYSHRRSP